jgi:hypothetical protein
VTRVLYRAVEGVLKGMTSSSTVERTSHEVAALDAILKWSRECPLWQRDALRRLCTKGRVEEADLIELVVVCKNNGASAVSLDAQHVRDPNSTNAVVTVRAIHSVDHVNALAAGERLTFGEAGLTIVYGDNGSGKSGYARILKQACRARSPKSDTVLANIYDSRRGTPTAIIDFSLNGQDRSAVWTRDEPADPLLSAVSIFDGRTASVHVEESNDLAYTPRPLQILAALAHTCVEVRRRLTSEIDAIAQQTPAALRKPVCRPSTMVGTLIAGLSDATKPDAVRQLASVTEADKARLATLRADLADDPARTARQLQQLAMRVERAVTRLEGLARASADDSVEALVASVRRFAAARDAARTASTGLFSSDPLPEIGSEAWRVLWEAARQYSETAVYLGQPFPATTNDARCVLCQQALNTDARERLERFESFVKNESSRLEALARDAYVQAMREVDAAYLSRQERAGIVSLVRDELRDDALSRELRQRVALHLWRLRRIRRRHGDAAEAGWPLAPPLPLDALRAKVTDLRLRIAALESDAASEQRTQLLAERDELADREWLAGIEEDVVAEIARRRAVARPQRAVRDTQTARITHKSTDIAETLVTTARVLRSRARSSAWAPHGSRSSCARSVAQNACRSSASVSSTNRPPRLARS